MAGAVGQRQAGKDAEKNIKSVVEDDPDFYDSGSMACLFSAKSTARCRLTFLSSASSSDTLNFFFTLIFAGGKVKDDRPRVTGKKPPPVRLPIRRPCEEHASDAMAGHL